MSSTKIQWRVQVRKSRAHKWVNKGLYETRSSARFHAAWMRDGLIMDDTNGALLGDYGFGNTRVVRYEKGAI